MKKHKNTVSGYWGSNGYKDPELMMREAFLRMAKDALDGYGIETYSVEQIRGGVMMLEKFNEIKAEE